MLSSAETLHRLREQRDRLEMEQREKMSRQVLNPKFEKLRQEIRYLGETPCC